MKLRLPFLARDDRLTPRNIVDACSELDGEARDLAIGFYSWAHTNVGCKSFSDVTNLVSMMSAQERRAAVALIRKDLNLKSDPPKPDPLMHRPPSADLRLHDPVVVVRPSGALVDVADQEIEAARVRALDQQAAGLPEGSCDSEPMGSRNCTVNLREMSLVGPPANPRARILSVTEHHDQDARQHFANLNARGRSRQTHEMHVAAVQPRSWLQLLLRRPAHQA